MGRNRQARARPQGRWGTRTLLVGMLAAALLGAATALLGCSLAAPPPGPAPERVHSQPVRLRDHAVAARDSGGEGQPRRPPAAGPGRSA